MMDKALWASAARPDAGQARRNCPYLVRKKASADMCASGVTQFGSGILRSLTAPTQWGRALLSLYLPKLTTLMLGV